MLCCCSTRGSGTNISGPAPSRLTLGLGVELAMLPLLTAVVLNVVARVLLLLPYPPQDHWGRLKALVLPHSRCIHTEQHAHTLSGRRWLHKMVINQPLWHPPPSSPPRHITTASDTCSGLYVGRKLAILSLPTADVQFGGCNAHAVVDVQIRHFTGRADVLDVPSNNVGKINPKPRPRVENWISKLCPSPFEASSPPPPSKLYLKLRTVRIPKKNRFRKFTFLSCRGWKTAQAGYAPPPCRPAGWPTRRR